VVVDAAAVPAWVVQRWVGGSRLDLYDQRGGKQQCTAGVIHFGTSAAELSVIIDAFTAPAGIVQCRAEENRLNLLNRWRAAVRSRSK
jgi:hypothetical protein